MKEVEIIAERLALEEDRVIGAIRLLNEGATVPFIARYRKDKTGNLDEVEIEKIKTELQNLKALEKRKETILSTIEEQGKLSAELKDRILNCFNTQELEDIYLPYKPRRKTLADKAIENGLEPLAKILMAQNGMHFGIEARKFINKDVPDEEEAIKGATDIAAQWTSERQNIRQRIRDLFWKTAVVESKVIKEKEREGEVYKDYFDFSEPVKKIKSHRILAILRGQKEEILKVTIAPDKDEAIALIAGMILKPNSLFEDEIQEVAKQTYTRLLKSSIETEVRNELKRLADEDAIKVFAENLRQLLLQSPLGGKRILALDPGYKSGCKLVCLNENGNLLHNETIYPHPPQSQKDMARKKVSTLVEQYKIDAIAIGNGTASRETEQFIKSIRFNQDLNVFVVNEAGASIYSASSVAREEFPDYDVTVRGAVSIGRRLMDPLAELVKIDPKSIGVGQYQHDVDQNLLKDQLDTVVESCVNKVGVDLNTASKYLLTYVSAVGPKLAENIVEYRKQNGDFKSREELKMVPKLGAKVYEQAAGFLRISNAKNPLDNSSVHPESYKVIEKICKDAGTSVKEMIGNESVINRIDWSAYVTEKTGVLTLTDIKKELLKPTRDPRTKAKVFEFDQNIRKLEDLQPGMQLPGIVNNITNFGAFVDIGIKENGLIHISNISDKYIESPAEVLNLHQHLMVKVITVDPIRRRIGLSIK